MTDADPLADLLGSSPAFEQVKTRARQMLARAKDGGRLPPVLIEGETGTGKGLLARALHQASPRARGAFVAVNCGAIPETLGESEFFGFARGAHSEARQPKIGLFQAADRGTIFLDEVGLLSEGHQARLLKVVEDRQVTAVGATRPVSVDVWMISATNADLSAQIGDGRFRRDLYERLAVITFMLPPLRERPGDIVGLAERFLARCCADYSLRRKQLAPDARRRLVEHHWPGNIRELSNVIERAALLVEAETIPADSLELASPVVVSASAPPAVGPAARRADQRKRVVEALERHAGNITWAAKDLGVSRKTLRDWMRQQGIYPSAESGAPAPSPGVVGGSRHEEPAGALLEEPETDPGLVVADVPAPRPAPPTLDAAAGGAAGIHWERRWIAILRVALSADRSGASDTTKALETVAGKVHMFGGRVTELGRTGLEAAFGLDPLEDAVQHAAFAALAIQRAGSRAREQSPDASAARIGLHADSYLIGRIGTSAQIDHEAKQSASALLGALVDAAAADGVMVSHAALPFLRRRFNLDGPITSGAVADAYRLVGRADRSDTFDTQISAFVGRESEIALLASRWALAAQGLGQIVGVVGDPGVGKSRLVWEFLHGGSSGPRHVLETASVAHGRPTPFLAIIELLRAHFGVEAADAPAVVREKVARRLGDLDPALAASMPAFLTLLDVPTGDAAWDGLEPGRRRQRTFDAIKRLMLRESARQPLLLVFEDAHWADSETQALLESMADSLPAARVLVLVTFRPEYQHVWGQRSFYTQIRVDPLRGEGVQRFLHDLLGEHPSLDALRARLVEWTEGNPFFLEETVWTLAETKALEGKRGAYRLVRPVTSITVPQTVHEVLAARMARLDPAAFDLLQSAAVVGRRVPHALLEAVSPFAADVAEALAVLQSREFLTRTDLADEEEFAFRHALTQEVAYASLPEDRRRALHARILEAIEGQTDRQDDRAAELAHHAFEGQRWEKAVDYLRRAGARAFARSANTEAAACYEQALAALGHLPVTRERQEAGIDVRFALRNALTPLAQAHRVLEHLREAHKLARLIGDDRRRARALSFAANSLCLVADFEGAIDASQQARDAAQSLGDFPLTVAAGMYLGRACAGLGQYRRAADVLREVAGSLAGDRVHDYLGLPVLPAVFARSLMVLALADLGEFAEAERVIGEAVAIAEQVRQPDTLLWAYVSAGTARLVRGQVAPATRALEHALELCRTADMPVYVPLVGSPLGVAYAMAGRAAEGLSMAEQAVEQTEARRQIALRKWAILRLGEVKLLAGDALAARDAASHALTLFREQKEQGGEAYALHLLASAEQAAGNIGSAEGALVRSHNLAVTLGMRPLAARCQLALAVLEGGDPSGAGTATRGAVARALDELGMEYWATQARQGRTV